MKEFKFNSHPEIKEGAHAIISPSRHILKPDYTLEQFENYIRSSYSTMIGTSIHELASELIKARIRVSNKEASKMIDLKLYQDRIPRNVYDPDNYISTFVPFVKDAIGFDMQSEQVLKYSDFAFGTADAIRFNNSKGELRIHDLKTGRIPANLDQLVAYAALFFLEYHLKPGDFKVTCCIYQNGDILTGLPTAPDILPIMDQIRNLSNYYERKYRNG